LAGQRRECQLAIPSVLRRRDDGRRLIAPPQQIFGEVQAAIREKPGAGKLVRRIDRACPALPDDAAERPDMPPEVGWRLHRPAVKIRIVGKRSTFGRFKISDECREPGGRDALRRRTPERLLRIHGTGSMWARVSSISCLSHAM